MVQQVPSLGVSTTHLIPAVLCIYLSFLHYHGPSQVSRMKMILLSQGPARSGSLCYIFAQLS